MENVIFRKPEYCDINEISAFKEDCQIAGSGMDGTGILFRSSAEEWLEYNKKLENREDVNVIPSLQYGLFGSENGKLLGLIQIRLQLKGYLVDFGGNIGYCVRPSERRRGYAKEMLYRALQLCRQEGLERVLVTCLVDNTASAKTIEACGGIYEKTVYDDKNYMADMNRYWIEL